MRRLFQHLQPILWCYCSSANESSSAASYYCSSTHRSAGTSSYRCSSASSNQCSRSRSYQCTNRITYSFSHPNTYSGTDASSLSRWIRVDWGVVGETKYNRKRIHRRSDEDFVGVGVEKVYTLHFSIDVKAKVTLYNVTIPFDTHKR